MAADQDSGIPRRWVFWTLFVFFVLLVVHSGVEVARSRREAQLLAGPTPILPVEGSGVRIRAWADESRVQAGDRLRVFVVIENRSDGAIGNLHLLPFSLPGFRPVKGDPCWLQGVPRCLPGDPTASHPVRLATDLPRGSALSLSAPLVPVGTVGSWNLTGIASFADAKGQMELPVAIGPIEVAPPPPGPVAIGVESLYTFFKDLGATIALAFLGFGFQELTRQREVRDRLRDQEREARDRKLDKERDSRERILAKATENAGRYLPLISVSRQLAKFAEDTRAATAPESRDEAAGFALYYLLMLLKRMQQLSLHGGGFFFRSLVAEKVLSRSWYLFLLAARERLGLLDLSLLLDAMDENDSITALEDKIYHAEGPRPARVAAYGKLRERLLLWSDGRAADGTALPDPLAAYGPLLKLMAEVVQYEVNRLYEPWYADEDGERRAEIRSLAVTLPGAIAEPQPGGLEKWCKAYLDELAKQTAAS